MARSGREPELQQPHDRLGYLLKHAHLRMAALNAAALAPLGVDPRELAILLLVAGQGPGSQQELAERLSIDRTSMVALVDSLEAKALVTRRPHPDDRRRNTVELTDLGRETTREGTELTRDAEAALLAPLSEAEARQLRRSLHRVVTPPPGAGRSSS